MLSNDRRAVGFDSSQLGLRDASIGEEEDWNEGAGCAMGEGLRIDEGVKLLRLRTALHTLKLSPQSSSGESHY